MENQGKIRKVFRKITEPFTDIYRVFKDDLKLGQIVRNTKDTLKRASSFAFGNLAVLPFYILGHEAIHALGYKGLGLNVDYLGVRKEVGGSLFSKIFPFVSTNVFEITKAGSLGAAGSSCFTSPLKVSLGLSAPYLATPLGIGLMRRGRKQGSLFTEGMGFLIATAPFRNLYDFSKISANLGFEQGTLENYLASGALILSTYAASHYLVDGFEKLKEKLRGKEKKEERIESRIKGAFSSARYYTGIAASSLALAWFGQPNVPIRIPDEERRANQQNVCDLFNSQQYGKVLEICRAPSGRYQTCDFKFLENIECSSYAELVARDKCTEEEALRGIAKGKTNHFYFHLFLAQRNRKRNDDSKKTLKKIDLESLTENQREAIERMTQAP